MSRLFFAVHTSASICDVLYEAQRDLLSIFGDAFRVEHLENSHVTLAFLGDVAEEKIEGLIEVARREIQATGVAPFSMRVVEVEPNHRRRAKVIWATAQPEEPFRQLHEATRRAAEAFGISIEARPYRPHLTLGRFQLTTDLRNVMLPRMPEASAVVTEVVLVESVLGAGIPKHTAIARFTLG